MSYEVRIIDHPHLYEAEIYTGESAARRALSYIPEWVLREAYEDHREMLEKGLKRAENGNSLWQQIENTAYTAVHKALKMERWYKQPETMHIEITFF